MAIDRNCSLLSVLKIGHKLLNWFCGDHNRYAAITIHCGTRNVTEFGERSGKNTFYNFERWHKKGTDKRNLLSTLLSLHSIVISTPHFTFIHIMKMSEQKGDMQHKKKLKENEGKK